jgi:hypothetical protein
MSKKSVAPIKTLARYEPDTVYIGTGEYVAECVRADDGGYYLAADVDAEIEWLRVKIERLREQLRLATVDQATAEAEANDARAEVETLLGALRQIAEWPDGGNLYGQEKIKGFAQRVIDATMQRTSGGDHD